MTVLTEAFSPKFIVLYVFVLSAVAIHYRERSLTSVPLARRLILRVKGVLNLIHALSMGYSRLLLDKFSHRKSKPGYP